MNVKINANLKRDFKVNFEEGFVEAMIEEYKYQSRLGNKEIISDEDILNTLKSENMKLPIIVAICSQALGKEFIYESYKGFIYEIDKYLDNLKDR